jgi:hypothetical protein
MNMYRWVDPRVDLVKVADLRSYLETHGWTPKPFPRPQVLKYEGPPDDAGQPIVLIAPASEKHSDYRNGVVDIITSLSALEDRHPVAVLNDILNQRASDGASGDNGANAALTVGAKLKGKRSPRRTAQRRKRTRSS